MDTKFTKTKRYVNFFVGVAVLITSIIFSREGFGFGTDNKYWWVGWILALAASASQFMLNSDWRKINISILAVAIPAYVYSVHTNIVGFYALRGGDPSLNLAYKDVLNVAGGIFMDLYPEIAISWALQESKIGDFFGNLYKLWRTPGSLTSESTTKQAVVAPPVPQAMPASIPRQTTFIQPYERR